jgi:hypothetical protein
MPQRHEPPRFREQQEEDAVDDRQRLLQGAVDRGRRTARNQGTEHIRGGVQDTVPERSANVRRVLFRSVNEVVEHGFAMAACGKGRCPEDRLKRCRRSPSSAHVEVEPHVAPQYRRLVDDPRECR